jgi:hypothetical protein
MSAVFAASPIIMQEAILAERAQSCPKELGGESCRAPATVRDRRTGDVNLVVDYLGDSTISTVMPV